MYYLGYFARLLLAPKVPKEKEAVQNLNSLFQTTRY